VGIDWQPAKVAYGNRRVDLRPRAVRCDQVVFKLGQLVANELQRIAADKGTVLAVCEVQCFEGSFDQPAAVIRIENIEAGPQAGDLGFDPELARGKAVESPEPGWRRSAGERRPDPAAHFGRRLVRESDGEDPASRNAAGRDAVDNRRGQRPRLAGAGAGKHQDGAALGGGFCLYRGEASHHQVRSRLRGGVHGGTARQLGPGWRPSATRACA